MKLADREIECRLCPRLCRLGDKERGYCGVRENVGGTYYTLVYGKVCSLNVDPIEKKPFFHVLPGTTALSLATAGCNFNCKFCQNWEISQARPEQVETIDLPPDAAAVAPRPDDGCPVHRLHLHRADRLLRIHGRHGRRARRKGIRNVVVTGGHINAEPLAELLRVVDAVKVDLKGFTPGLLRSATSAASSSPCSRRIQAVAKTKVWLEIVYLVIPTLNDRPDRDPRDGPLGPGRGGSGRPPPLLPLPPDVPGQEPAPDARVRRSRRPGATALEEGPPLRLRGQRPGPRGRETRSVPGAARRSSPGPPTGSTPSGSTRAGCEKCGTIIPGIWT